ncbi:MAG: L-threonylcarbamoyladenylate synthase [bacterium]|nr:L-threonylcarbamoyladenylate synthase [bacterium]
MTTRLLDRARALLAEGKVVGVPTDTVYGLATHLSAQQELFAVKGRPPDKAIAVLVGSVADAMEMALFPRVARELADAHWPGPLTLVVSSKGSTEEDGPTTVGLRMPDHPVALELLNLCGPLAVTSANRSGDSPAHSHVEARDVFGDRIELYLPGLCPGGVASTVIEALANRQPKVLRPGPISL